MNDVIKSLAYKATTGYISKFTNANMALNMDKNEEPIKQLLDLNGTVRDKFKDIEKTIEELWNKNDIHPITFLIHMADMLNGLQSVICAIKDDRYGSQSEDDRKIYEQLYIKTADVVMSLRSIIAYMVCDNQYLTNNVLDTLEE